MGNDITVLIADPQRMTAFRDELHLRGRVLRFSSTNLASVLESIRTNQPGIVAIDSVFAGTAQGRIFVERIGKLGIPPSEIQLVTRLNTGWGTRPLAQADLPQPMVDVKSTDLNTRRTPRFLVLDPLHATVESGGTAGLVDISVMGAQVVSEPVLRPNQKIRVALPDGDESLLVTAHVAWSLFEKPNHVPQPYYRAGMEFTDAARQALEEYLRRHCAEDPIPSRRR
jgi:PilZ domain-containing protein